MTIFTDNVLSLNAFKYFIRAVERIGKICNSVFKITFFLFFQWSSVKKALSLKGYLVSSYTNSSNKIFLQILLHLPKQKSLQTYQKETYVINTLFHNPGSNKTTGQPIIWKGKSERELFCLHFLSMLVAALSAQEHQILLDVVQEMVLLKIYSLTLAFERGNCPW